MRAILLAAGRGSRLGKLGEDRPKCCVELAGVPLVERQLAALRRGTQALGIVRGYRAEMLERPDATGFDNPRWAETNMVSSLATADEWLRAGPAIVSYGDIFYPADLVGRLAAAPGDLVIAYDRGWLDLWQRRFDDPLSDAETFRVDEHGRLLEIGGKTQTLSAIEGQYMGLLKFTPTAWRWVQELRAGLDDATRDRLDMTGLLSRLIAQGRAIHTVAVDGPWGEVDNAQDLALYERMIASGELILEPLGN